MTVLFDSDIAQNFMLGQNSTRGTVLSLADAWQTIAQQRDYPPVLRNLLGQATVAATLLHSLLNWSGTVALQIQGKHGLHFLVVECSAQAPFQLRATAQWDEAQTDVTCPEDYLQGGQMMISFDPRDERPSYRSVVPLEHGSLAANLSHYMKQSEQIETHCWLECHEQVAAGLLIQHIPEQGGTLDAESEPIDPDCWPRVVQFAHTLRVGELCAHSPVMLLHRLFGQEPDLRLTRAVETTFHCPCSKERVKSMLCLLGGDEIRSLQAESKNVVTIHCDYCNTGYGFSSEELGALARDLAQGVTTTSCH